MISKERKRIYDKAYRKAHREERLIKKKAYYQANREKIRAYNKARLEHSRIHREKNKERINAGRRGRYRFRNRCGRTGMTKKIFNALFEAQGQKCASCGTTEFDGHGPCVDHDHSTGRIRGILCNSCNMAEGYLKSDPARARNLADYLEKHGKV